MLPATSERVRQNTADEINQRIPQRTERNIMECITAGEEAIDGRLDEIDEERYALKALRSDFKKLSRAKKDTTADGRVVDAIAAVRS